MGSIISFLVTSLFNLLLTFLPLSPFVNLTLGDEVGTAVGWLNWCIDVHGMVTMFGLWLAAATVVAVVQVVRDNLDWILGMAGL